MSDAPVDRSKLTPKQRALFELLRKSQRPNPEPPLSTIPRRGSDVERIPASHAQRRLWFFDQLEPGSPAFNMARRVRLVGRLDLDALEYAFNALLRRHEILRTTFEAEGGEPLQRIHAPSPRSLPRVDLSALAAPERAAEASRMAHEEARKPFDLEKGPLLRCTLLRFGEHEHELLATMHHIVTDGWSMGIFVRELATHYRAAHLGRPSAIDELPIQYADYALWQHQRLTEKALERPMAFWTDLLDGAPAALELPTDRPRPPAQTYRGALHHLELPPDLVGGLRELARREGVTLFMTMLAAFQVLLGRYAGQDDIVVGSPVANRSQAELDGLIGFFINMLPLRTKLNGDPPFRELLQRVKEMALGAYAHQELPFELLIGKLGAARDLGRSPLVQAVFVLQNAPKVQLDLGDELKLDFEDIETATSKFDLTLYADETKHGFQCSFEYDSDLFDAASIERMARNFRVLLEGAVQDPGTRIGSLPLLTAEEAQWFDAWNGPPPIDVPACIPAPFERQVQATPDAIALVHGHERLRYDELNRRANRLAHRLRALGIGPDVVVGISAERSPRLIVGILGILKAGGAYLPIDPNYPKTRVAHMLSHSGVSVLLTERHLVEKLPEHGAHSIYLDEEAPPADEHNPEHFSHPELLGYVMYTSGSTGRPKGVAMRTGALCNLVAWQIANSVAREGTRTLQFPSFSFDVSFQDTFSTLNTGGTLVLSSDEQRMDASQLLELLAAEHIERLFIPVVMLHQLARRATPQMCARLSLREITIGGEVLRVNDDVRAFLRSIPGCRLFNHYGPTETHVTTSWKGPELADHIPDLPPIGRPLTHVSAHVLDPSLQRVPLGVPGEVFHGGVQVARGYYRDPALTAERFIPDPYGPPGSRMYRTGDHARLQDGELRFLGRKDGQVKLRGYRIELGEVEAALRRQAGVREAVVLAREDTPGEKRLVAYIQADGDAPAATTLHDALARDLPEYMVPSLYVKMESWPLTPSGKLHRKGLPPPDDAALRVSRTDDAARTPMERAVADAFAAVLGLQHVGLNDNFFLLGGHSLLATQLILRLRSLLELQVPIRAIFEAPTVRALSERLGASERGWKVSAPPLTRARAERREHPPLSFAQQRLWFLDRLEPSSTAYTIPFALRLHGDLRVDALRLAIEDIVRRHEVLRTTFPLHDGAPVQRIHAPSPWALPVIDLAALSPAVQEGAVQRYADSLAREPFELARGPLLRTSLCRLGEADHVLIGAMHHIVSDGWSIAVLIRELTAHYEARRDGRVAQLPELPVQVVDHAIWQRDWLEGRILEEQLGYWKHRLAGVTPLELPTDRPRSGSSDRAGAEVSIAIPGALADGLRGLAQREEATIFMVLLAALQSLLGRWCGQTDIAVGTPIAERPHEELEELIGFFVNTLVLRSDLGGDPTFAELVAQVKETTLGAYAHQAIPFERLVEALSPPRDLGRTPLFQVMLTLQNAPAETLRLAGLTARGFELAPGPAMFDLSLDLREEGSLLRGSFRYAPALFDRITIERLRERFLSVLESVVRDPEVRVSRLPLLTSGEQAILARINDTERAHSGPRCIHECFEAQVARTPEADAVVFEGQRLSYRALNERANQLAHHLRVRGVGPEIVVGLLLERSAEWLVAVMGILKAGGAYLPLDPNHPRARLARILQMSRAGIVVVHSRLREKLADCSVETLGIDELPPAEGLQPLDPVEKRVRADHAAYVIYTSGSTGAPKGVVVEHRSVVNLWQSYVRIVSEVGRGPLRVSLNAPLTFDASIQQWAHLLSGHTIVIVPEAARLDPRQMMAWVKAERLDAVDVTPSQLRTWLDVGLADIRLLEVGGEAIDEELWSRLRAIPKMVAVNEYGPTECTVDTTICVISSGAPSEEATSERATSEEATSERPSLGEPVDNTQLYVLDRGHDIVPLGVAGELYIAGEALARGYLNDPAQTAARFVPNPFGRPGSRMYRTGDIVRRDSDSVLRYVGREDGQVKIRGNRIELGEIEAVLVAHPHVREAVVVQADGRGGDGDARLIAYWLPTGEPPPSPTLREHASRALPGYMVPAAYVMLDRWPLTPNGKLDRRALPKPVYEASAADAPRSSLERALMDVFADVLQLPRVGLHDDFFALGGHSLLAVRLAIRIEKTLGRSVSLSQVIHTPTVAGLSAAMEEGSAAPPSTILPLRTTGALPPLFFVHAIGGSALGYQSLARALGDEQPFYGLQAAGIDGGERPCTTVEDMVQRYLEAIRNIQPKGPYRLGGWSFGGVVAREMAHRLIERGEQVDALVLVDTWAPTFAGRSDPQSKQTLLLGLANELGLEVDPERLKALHPSDHLAHVGEQAALHGLCSAGAAESFITRLLHVLEAHIEALRGYVPRIYPGPITLIRAEEAPTAESARRLAEDPTCGWAEWSELPIEVHSVAGDHYSIVRPPNVTALAATLSRALRRLDRSN
ncbi:amino acid adenylation domain-containing protein [Pendulispora albinea]|uniref:Amino acid adenylation domain-containing protein n=1 Tax=Pendulispora albinea TaxID=2741071 RepID=A0ABZ2LSP0_9BACT